MGVTMSARRIRQGLIAMLGGVLAVMVIGGVAPAANAAPGQASVLKGTWVGTYSGYDANGYHSGQEKIVITKVKGSNASGTWQYRSSAKNKWSKPKPVNFSIYAQENDDAMPTDYLSGGDADGMYVGKLDTSENRLVFSYTARAKNILVLTFDLRKQ